MCGSICTPSVPAGLIDLQQISPEPAGQDQLLIQTGAVFPKEGMAHTAILSKGYDFQGDGEIRDEAVPAGNAVDVHDDPPFAAASLCWV